MGARETIASCAATRDAAAHAVAAAEAAHAMARAEADSADRRLGEIVQAEHEAAGDLAERIRQATSTGEGLKARKPLVDTVARSVAETEARSAHTALALLACDLDDAKKQLATSQDAVSAATHDACSEKAAEIAAGMAAALEVIRDGHRHIVAIEAAAFTLQPGGPKRMRLDEIGLQMRAFDFTPGWWYPADKAALVDQWRAWRSGLADDVDVASPWTPA